jgi:putative SOS response-associated peptidase YedK
MCGRFVRYTPVARFAELFHAHGHPESWASYNIAPSTRVLVARNASHGGRELASLK